MICPDVTDAVSSPIMTGTMSSPESLADAPLATCRKVGR
jgi:hypothetical protein